MSAPPTKVFGRGLARTMQVVFAFQVVVQSFMAASVWNQDGGPGWRSILSIAVAVVSAVVVLIAETGIVRVGPERIRWRDRLGRPIDLSCDEVADVRKHPRKNRVQLVTTDGQVLPLPVQPDDGPAVWWVLFGERAADALPDRG